jgi:hypothetical protein
MLHYDKKLRYIYGIVRRIAKEERPIQRDEMFSDVIDASM